MEANSGPNESRPPLSEPIENGKILDSNGTSLPTASFSPSSLPLPVMNEFTTMSSYGTTPTSALHNSFDIPDNHHNFSSETQTPKPRSYQMDLFSRACSQNIIACLPTGAGKTLVAALLIQHVLEHQPLKPLPPQVDREVSPTNIEVCLMPSHSEESNDILVHQSTSFLSNPVNASPWSLSGVQQSQVPSIIVFIVDRVPLAVQQATMLKSFLPPNHQVACYHGDCGYDLSPEYWASNMSRFDVFVMTAQIFLNLLKHSLITMSQVSLLIFDEAHHATKSHPYRRICIEFYHTTEPDVPRPRIFGMTATPVKRKRGTTKHESCLTAVAALEATLDATVVTISFNGYQEVGSIVSRPEEYIITYRDHRYDVEGIDSCEYDLDYSVISSLIESFPTPDVDMTTVTSSNAVRTKVELSEAELKVIFHVNICLGFIAAQEVAIHLCGKRGVDPHFIISSMASQYGDGTNCIGITDKTRRLLDLLFFEFQRFRNESESSDKTVPSSSEGFRAIVFTNQRMFTIALSALITNTFKETGEKELVARPLMGSNQNGLGTRISQGKMRETVNSFRNGEYGILVATNVVEEGIDVPACGLVIAFDYACSPTAYIQGRGRARKQGARYFSFVCEGSESDARTVYAVRHGAQVMTDIVHGAHVTEVGREKNRETLLFDKNKEKMLYSRSTPAKITASDALGLLNRYLALKAQSLGITCLKPPQFKILKDGPLYSATLLLDPKVPIEMGVCDEFQESEGLAKKLAALDAYKRLYEIGEVDEHLLPKTQENHAIKSRMCGGDQSRKVCDEHMR